VTNTIIYYTKELFTAVIVLYSPLWGNYSANHCKVILLYELSLYVTYLWSKQYIFKAVYVHEIIVQSSRRISREIFNRCSSQTKRQRERILTLNIKRLEESSTSKFIIKDPGIVNLNYLAIQELGPMLSNFSRL